jgi:hypothetical protein
MSFTFKTEVLGVEMEVEGSFSHPCDIGESAYFEIAFLRHKGEDLHWCDLSDIILYCIETKAFKEAAKAAMQAEEDQAQELLDL